MPQQLKVVSTDKPKFSKVYEKAPCFSLSDSETIDLIHSAISRFSGSVLVLNSAIGYLFVGRLVGWRVLLLIHNKRTIRIYDEILSINSREFFPEFGSSSAASEAYVNASGKDKFWKIVSGEIKGIKTPDVNFSSLNSK